MKAVIATTLLLAAACGPKHDNHLPSTWASFDCRDRKVAYYVVGGMAAQEAGVEVSCAPPQGPHVMRYAVDRDGTRTEASQAMTPGEFLDVWKEIEGTGWRHLDDCAPDPGDDIPVYSFEVKMDEESATIGCDSLRPEYPYNIFVDTLDERAALIEGDEGKNTVDVDDSDLDLKN